MAKKKLRVGILFGGKSGEHDISLRSARSILAAIDRKKYDVVELGITKEGRWLPPRAAAGLLTGGDASSGVVQKGGDDGDDAVSGREVSIVAAAGEPAAGAGLDVVFPVLHG